MNESQLGSIRECLSECDESVNIQHITEHEMRNLDAIANDSFQELRLSEKVYWSTLHQGKSEIIESSWSSKILGALILKPQESMERYRKERDTITKSIDSISKSIIVKGE